MKNDTLMKKNFFEEEEKIIINHLGLEGSKQDCCKQIEMGIIVNNDKDIANLMCDLLKKIENMTEDEWMEIQSNLPFLVTISDEDL